MSYKIKMNAFLYLKVLFEKLIELSISWHEKIAVVLQNINFIYF
jgi:hypothetical protein